MNTLVMLHGMTGTSEMMMPFAEKICPDGWTLQVPEAVFEHPRRGLTWWRYEEEDENSPKRIHLSRRELDDLDASLGPLAEEIEMDSLGSVIIGGFSQGGVVAQELLQTSLADMVEGVVCIGTRAVRPLELRLRLDNAMPGKMLWMHGENDQRVPLEAGIEVAEIFEEAGWDVTRIIHPKGHMIPLEYHEEVKHWLNQFNS